MGFRELRTYWPSSLVGALCGLMTMAGVWLAAFTDRRDLGAVLIVAGSMLLIVAVIVASKLRKPGQPL